MGNSCFAQSGASSPYSIYGLGDISETGFHRNNGMGGISLALREPKSINLSNPASYTSFKQNSFVFDIGTEIKRLTLNTVDTSQSTYNSSLSYLAFGFPVTKWWGSSFGLRPFSVINYKVTDERTLDNIGDVSYIYEGRGGINEVYWGNAIQIGGLSIGGNLSYLFGPLTKTRSEIFTLANTFHYFTSEKINIGGAYYKVGMQYQHVIDSVGANARKNKITLTAGAIMDFDASLKARRTTLGVTFDDFLLDPFLILPKDTVLNVTDTGNILLPGGYGIGFSFDYGNKLLIGIDYYSKSWSDFKIFDVQDSLGDYTRLALGLQFTPDPNSSTSYLKTVQYRMGYLRENTHLVLRGQQLTKSGISFGIGLPLKRIRSTLNFALEVGTRGTTDNSLLQENYWKAGFGLTLSDIWFVKRKYD
ncbi:MAG: hypothetical protein JKX74_08475 [Flavobacteriales bacterium]|nr:hypothetical protein [Flavobacteriales bacterium]